MPTYAYTCTVCDHSFDVHQSFADAPLTVCPECSGKLRKVFSPVGVVFKGSGFYRTDARSSTKSTVSNSPTWRRYWDRIFSLVAIVILLRRHDCPPPDRDGGAP